MSEQPPGASGSVRPDLLHTSLDERDGAVIVRLTGEIDMTTVDIASAALNEAIPSTGTMVVDMTGIRFFASAGLNLLLRLHKKVENRGITVLLAGDQRTVVRPLELMGLTDLFPIHSTVDNALAAAGQ